MVPLVRKVMKQTRARILRGDGKLVSLFEPETEIIRKGNAGKPTEFGKMVKPQEAENQIVTDYEVYEPPAAAAPCRAMRRCGQGIREASMRTSSATTQASPNLPAASYC
jgi:hypothetical protein